MYFKRFLLSLLSMLTLLGILVGATYAWFVANTKFDTHFEIVGYDIAITNPDNTPTAVLSRTLAPTAFSVTDKYCVGNEMQQAHIPKLKADVNTLRIPLKVTLVNEWNGSVIVKVSSGAASKDNHYDEIHQAFYMAIFSGAEVDDESELLACGSFADFEAGIAVIDDPEVFEDDGHNFVTLVIWVDGVTVNDDYADKRLDASIGFWSEFDAAYA